MNPEAIKPRYWQRLVRDRYQNAQYTPNPAMLENWLGADNVAHISRQMRNWPGPPIALAGIPGDVFATAGGDFCGRINVGREDSVYDRVETIARREIKRRMWNFADRTRQRGAFTNLSALIAAQTGGKGQPLFFQKVGVTANATGNCIDLSTARPLPSAGAAGGAAPTGTSPTNSTTGALAYTNPANTNTGHFVLGEVTGGNNANTLMLYDRLFSVAKTMNSTATEAVTGTFSRYQSGTATNEDYIGGNFCFPSDPTTVLPATAHNWTVCQYTDQGSNIAQSFPSIAGVSACVLRGIDLAVGNWFMPYAAGDVGVKALTQMQCSALVATGTIDFVVGHPIAWMPNAIANMICVTDGINTAFNLIRVYDNACLAFIEMPKPSTTAVTYSGKVLIVAE